MTLYACPGLHRARSPVASNSNALKFILFDV
jgi:hypothetical protein